MYGHRQSGKRVNWGFPDHMARAFDEQLKLGYKNPSNALQVHVDSDDKTSYLIQVSGSNYKANTLFVNESGLYSLFLASKLPQAKAFKRWVAKECFPFFAFLSVLFSCFWRFVCRCRDFCVTLHNQMS